MKADRWRLHKWKITAFAERGLIDCLNRFQQFFGLIEIEPVATVDQSPHMATHSSQYVCCEFLPVLVDQLRELAECPGRDRPGLYKGYLLWRAEKEEAEVAKVETGRRVRRREMNRETNIER